ncbi:hypothetical protein [Propionivibrio sp.]|uniref:hypothetical protein n=1 Tax=Propionivibrio sp. TaxID=2212460 RepID=UPI0025EB87E0|nr:hypothetical protein [Propionivibrio sp.]MBK7357452.1 hypothetical protein [Propionivibrio sp.]
MEKNHWTTAEESLLRKHFPTMTARQIGEMMGRSGNAVMQDGALHGPEEAPLRARTGDQVRDEGGR